ncbi:MAG: hypothetical protein B7Z10_02940 [Rhodobacterales bacterium 32-66-7]|nr:MAG: hypothetical protein B7Z31_05730 [Rhodobacterales bacterium 12-65-15]OYX26539.1 MAG: hypothetical protein B7Z10_02940 [Rhodobacterales bacterium 32-66-7]
MTGSPTLRSVFDAEADGAAAFAFYAEVMGLVPDRSGAKGADLGSADPEAVALAEAVLACRGKLPAAVVRRRLASLRTEAASRVRAAQAAGSDLRAGGGLGPGAVDSDPATIAHAGFFALEVQRLRHRRFDGRMSETLRREVFVACDAVTVLPYDPVRDRVLVIEQFRVGPLRRGDPVPWQLEPIAGRIDPGETPADCARREALEEAGLALGALEKVAEYYPSPGAMSEYLYSYVAISDLPDGCAGVFGKPEEAEDIKGHLLELDALMAAVAGGEVTNGPLILTALWLARERSRLRQNGRGQIAHPTLP